MSHVRARCPTMYCATRRQDRQEVASASAWQRSTRRYPTKCVGLRGWYDQPPLEVADVLDVSPSFLPALDCSTRAHSAPGACTPAPPIRRKRKCTQMRPAGELGCACWQARCAASPYHSSRRSGGIVPAADATRALNLARRDNGLPVDAPRSVQEGGKQAGCLGPSLVLRPGRSDRGMSQRVPWHVADYQSPHQHLSQPMEA
jgi:hypothetical protein